MSFCDAMLPLYIVTFIYIKHFVSVILKNHSLHKYKKLGTYNSVFVMYSGIATFNYIVGKGQF